MTLSQIVLKTQSKNIVFNALIFRARVYVLIYTLIIKKENVMNLRTISRYNLRQLSLPQEYQIRFTMVKQIITRITGKRPSSELAFMAMIDEFLNLHGGGDFDAQEGAHSAHENIDLITSTSEGSSNDQGVLGGQLVLIAYDPDSK